MKQEKAFQLCAYRNLVSVLFLLHLSYDRPKLGFTLFISHSSEDTV